MLVASRLYPRLPDDVDPAHPLAALTPDKLYMLPDSPHAARLRELADQEITQLLRRAGDDLALDVLGLLTAARGGPLADADLATLTGSRPWKVRGVLDGEAARTLQQVGPADTPRYTFAHETLLARCQEQGVGDPGHTRRIDEWAATWRDRGWPTAHDGKQGTPLYLLDRYPQTLYDDPPRLAALAGDAGWVTAAIQTLGVDAVLAELKTAGAAAPGEPRLAAMHAVVRGQAHHLRDREAAGDPGFVPRQLCLQAAELGETLLAADFRTRQLASDDPGPVLQWTTRRASPALVLELGRHDGGVAAVAVLPDGRVVTGGGGRRAGAGVGPGGPGRRPGRARPPRRRGGGGGGAAGRAGGHRRRRDGRVLVWDPAEPGAAPVELGRHEGGVDALAVLPDGRVVTGGDATAGCWCGTRRSRAPARSSSAATRARWRRWRCCRTGGWSPAAARTTGGCWCGTRPTRAPARPSSAATTAEVTAVAVLPDGRVVTGGGDGGGCWCGTRPTRAPARSSSAATTAGWGRWRCCRTGGWSPAAASRPAGAGVGPGPAGRRPGRARPPRRRGGGGGGAAGRAGGHRRR